MNLLQWVIPWSNIVGEAISSVERGSEIGFLNLNCKNLNLKTHMLLFYTDRFAEGGTAEMQFSFQKDYKCCQKPSYLKNFVLLCTDWFVYEIGRVRSSEK